MDGTSRETSLIRDFADTDIIVGRDGRDVNGTVYFSASRSIYEVIYGQPSWSSIQELWSSDGTSSGTQMVDTWDRDGQSRVFMAGLSGKLYFTQTDAEHGIELWESNGTAAGTKLVDDIYSGNKSGLLGSYLTVGPKLYFFANDGYRGNELWYIDSRPLSADIGASYSIHEGDSLTLHATATGNAESYSWDINGDGVFGDALGSDPTLTWTQLQTLSILDGPGNYSISVQVIDAARNSLVSDAASLTVVNSPPSLSVSGPTSAIDGQSVSFTLIAGDLSFLDQSSSFNFAIDWDSDGTIDQTLISASSVTVSHIFNTPGLFGVIFTVTDKDGSQSAPVTRGVAVAGWVLDHGNLIWNGTNGNDSVIFAETSSQQVTLIVLALNGVATSQQTIISGVTGSVIAYGNAGNDVINASSLTTISTELRGDASNDTISGGAGSNLIYGDGDGGEGGSDSIVGGNGGNSIYADGSEGNADTVIGGNGDDAIYSDPIDGAEGGADSVSGGAGNDLIDGGTGSDTLRGESGNDLLIGGNGADSLLGGTGEDLIIAGRLTPDFYVNGIGIQQIWDQWRSADPIGLRKNYLDGTVVGGIVDSSFKLLTGVTVLNDSMVDSAIADDDGDIDWLIADTSVDLISAGVQDLLTDL